MAHHSDISAIHPHEAALDLIPECVARESSVLPVSVATDSIHVIVPENHAESSIIDKLRFVLNLNVTFDTAAREQIDLKVNQYFPRPGAAAYSPIAADAELPDTIPDFEIRSEFPFLDLVGQVEHSTPASVSFSLGRWSNKLQLEDSVRTFDRECVFTGVGWLDAHFPCTGLHRLFVRCHLPPDYIQYEKMCELLQFVTSALELPDSVSYRIYLESKESGMSTEHPPSGFYS